MNRFTMLLLAFSLALVGCAGLYQSPKDDAEPAMNMTFTRVFGNYMIRSPEPMKIAFRIPDGARLNCTRTPIRRW